MLLRISPTQTVRVTHSAIQRHERRGHPLSRLLADLGTFGKDEDAATFQAVSAKVAKAVLGVTVNAVE